VPTSTRRVWSEWYSAVSFGVYPCALTAAGAALAPCALDSPPVNAGSGAERVVDVPGVALVAVGVVGAVAVLVDFAVLVVVAAVCETGGAPEAVTVFVDDPHAASVAVAHAANVIETAFSPSRRID